MLNLNDREWKPFFLTELFPVIQRGKRLKSENHIPGEMPYVSSSALCNGVDNFISNTEKVRIFSNCISLANSGSVGSSFYEPFSFVASDHVTHLKNEKYNKYHYLFIASIMNRLSQKYNFNREINDNRISREKIMLPIDTEGNLDLDFMEQYIKERERQLIQKYKGFIGENIQSGVLKQINSLTWKEFRILDLFDYQRGNQNNMNSLSHGNEMLISAKNINNGLKGFFSSNDSQKGLYQGNCITLNNDGDGGVGLAYYQPYSFLLDAHVYALYPKADIGKYAMLYISRTISKQRECFSHGYSINQERLKKLKIMLPIDEKENPDYDYMEQYGKKIMLQKYQQYLDYISA